MGDVSSSGKNPATWDAQAWDAQARDWLALWQSELTAMAADRELREGWATLFALWSTAAGMALDLVKPHDPAARTAGAAQPPRPAAAAAASEPGLDEIRRLSRRIAELEQRLAAFERPG